MIKEHIDSIIQAADVWRKAHPEHALIGYVNVGRQMLSGGYCALGWVADLSLHPPDHWAQGFYLVSFQNQVLVTVGHGTEGGAARFEEILAAGGDQRRVCDHKRYYRIPISDHLRVVFEISIFEDVSLPAPQELERWQRRPVTDICVAEAFFMLASSRDLSRYQDC